MEALTITLSQVRQALELIKAEVPKGYSYEIDGQKAFGSDCRYAITTTHSHEGDDEDETGTVVSASCVIGRIIDKISPATLQVIVNRGMNRGNTVAVLFMDSTLDGPARVLREGEPGVRHLLNELQSLSDNGNEWHERVIDWGLKRITEIEAANATPSPFTSTDDVIIAIIEQED